MMPTRLGTRLQLASMLVVAGLLGAGCAQIAGSPGPQVSGVSSASARAPASTAFTASPASSPLPASAPQLRAAPETATGWTRKQIVHANRLMVVAANPLASDAGLRVLAAGGSAVDAAIATQLVLNLVEPQSSGIGGGGFMLHFDAASGQVRSYDGRETAPREASQELFVGADGKVLNFRAAVDSGLSVGTPGLLRMLELAHSRHGRLPWSRLFDDAIRIAERGFLISPRLASQIATAAARIAKQGAPVKDYFLDADGSPKRAGTLLRNPALAATLRAIARDGTRAFYQGPLAEAIVAKVRAHPSHPGRLSVADLAGYQAREREPVCGRYRDYRICGMGPPSSGAVTMLQTLGILQNFALNRYAPDSVDAIHLISDAYRLAYADRARYLADADFVSVPTKALLEARYLSERAALIRMDRSIGKAQAGRPDALASLPGLDESPSLPSTTHMAIVDANGDAISMTTSVEYAFGSLQMVGGFLLNNQLTDFSFRPRDADGAPIANRVEPGKRPRSSMSPTIVVDRDGRLEALLGSPGGSRIIQYVTKTLIGLIDWKLDIQQAIELQNFGAQTDATTTLERRSADGLLEHGLEARGHRLRFAEQTSGIHGIVFNGLRADGRPGGLTQDPAAGRWAGGADPRREGVALGAD